MSLSASAFFICLYASIDLLHIDKAIQLWFFRSGDLNNVFRDSGSGPFHRGIVVSRAENFTLKMARYRYASKGKSAGVS
jgi:hypothetical protein